MKYMDRKKLWCIPAELFYAYVAVSRYKPFRYGSLFSGAGYGGYVLFYAVTLFLFGIVLFSGFGDTEKYMNGYGILEITRSRRRITVIRKIIWGQMTSMFFAEVRVTLFFLVIAQIFGEQEEAFLIGGWLTNIVLFGVVGFSLLLWQSFFEILWDSRIALLGTFSIICIHLCAGDIVYLNKGNELWNLLFYSNLALSARTEILSIEKIWMFLVILGVCVVQIFLLNLVYKKKDIFSVLK